MDNYNRNIYFRAFTDSEKWDRLWEVMLYCNEMENFVVPTFCQEKALRAMLKEPNSYFNYAVQFLLNSDVERLHRLDKQVRKCFVNFLFVLFAILLSGISGAPLAQLVEYRTLDHKVVCSILTRVAVLCPWARHFIFIA